MKPAITFNGKPLDPKLYVFGEKTIEVVELKDKPPFERIPTENPLWPKDFNR